MNKLFIVTAWSGLYAEDTEYWNVAVATTENHAKEVIARCEQANAELRAYIDAFNEQAELRGTNRVGIPYEWWQCEMSMSQYDNRLELSEGTYHPAVCQAWRDAPVHPDAGMSISSGQWPVYDINEVPSAAEFLKRAGRRDERH